MAYTINLTNGDEFATVEEGNVDNTSSITLVGKNVANYGEILNENYMRLLESHANADTTPPPAPLTGQLWFDKTASTLRVWDGGQFKNLGAANPAATVPTGSSLGDFWFNTTTEQTYIFNDTEYVLVGPVSSVADNSGPVVVTIQDTGANDHIIVQHLVDGVIVGITSSDAEFTPSPAITGFATIAPGYNLNSTISATFTGTATHATLADTATLAVNATNADDAALLDTLDSTQFLRSDQADTTNSTLGIVNDGGLTIGTDSDLEITINVSATEIRNTTLNGNMIFAVNDGGVDTNVITIDGSRGRATVATPSLSTDIANQQYVTDQLASGLGAKLSLSGADTMAGAIKMGTNKVTGLGAATLGTDALNRDTGDGRYLTRDISSNVNTSGGVLTRFYNDAGATGGFNNASNTLQIYQPSTGADAYQTFHVSGDYAVNFGLDGGTNDLFVGGWSMGSGVQHKIWHAGNDGSSSGLDADLLDGKHASSFVLTTDNNSAEVRYSASGSSSSSIYLTAGSWAIEVHGRCHQAIQSSLYLKFANWTLDVSSNLGDPPGTTYIPMFANINLALSAGWYTATITTTSGWPSTSNCGARVFVRATRQG